MAKLLKLRRGTTTQHSSFTGAEGEVTVDTDKETLVVHDGSTAGGHPVAAEDLANVSSSTIAGRLSNDSIAVSKIAAGTLPSDVKIQDANVSGNLTIVNADVTSSAAIAGTKISPDFGSQAITATNGFLLGGTLSLGTANTASGHLNAFEAMTFNIDSDNDDTNRSFKWYKDGSSGSGTQLLALDESGTLTLGGQATLQGGAAVTGNITTTSGSLTVDGIGSVEDTFKITDAAGTQYLLMGNQDSAGTNSPRVFAVGNANLNIGVGDSWSSNTGGTLTNQFSIGKTGPITSHVNHDFSSGIDVTGNITVTGTVDGRDVASDGSKLDGIESGATADQTANEILTLIKTVDGAGSGLNADVLDGISSASFVRSDASDTLTGGTYTFSTGTDEKIILAGSNTPYIRFQEGSTDKAYIQWHSDGYLQLRNTEDGSGIRMRDDLRFSTDNFSSTNYKIWHAGNDGSGSGLDADTLDGMNASSGTGANTIVQRNASGYVFANYFNTSPNDVSSGVTKVCVETGNDGYIRHGDAAAIRSFINVENGATADQTGSEIANALGAQNIYTTANFGRDGNDYFKFTDNNRLDLYIAGNNEFRFESDGDFHADGDVYAYSSTTASDENLKKDVVTVADAVTKVEALKGVTFKWKKNDVESAGVIAQDVEKVLPQVVKVVADTDGTEFKAVNYGGLTSLLIEAVKDLSARIKVLEAK